MTYCERLGDTSVISTTSPLQSADLAQVRHGRVRPRLAPFGSVRHRRGAAFGPGGGTVLVLGLFGLGIVEGAEGCGGLVDLGEKVKGQARGVDDRGLSRGDGT